MQLAMLQHPLSFHEDLDGFICRNVMQRINNFSRVNAPPFFLQKLSLDYTERQSRPLKLSTPMS